MQVLHFDTEADAKNAFMLLKELARQYENKAQALQFHAETLDNEADQIAEDQGWDKQDNQPHIYDENGNETSIQGMTFPNPTPAMNFVQGRVGLRKTEGNGER